MQAGPGLEPRCVYCYALGPKHENQGTTGKPEAWHKEHNVSLHMGVREAPWRRGPLSWTLMDV